MECERTMVQDLSHSSTTLKEGKQMNELGRGLRFLRICLVIVCEFSETTVSSEESGAGRETERQRERREERGRNRKSERMEKHHHF